jgi:hypothetical protein
MILSGSLEIDAIANYLLVYGSTPGAALKAPQDIAQGNALGL